MVDALEMERNLIVAATKAEFATGPQTLGRMEAIAHRHCGSWWWPTCMTVIGGFYVGIFERQLYPGNILLSV